MNAYNTSEAKITKFILNGKVRYGLVTWFPGQPERGMTNKTIKNWANRQGAAECARRQNYRIISN